jgi:uracil-DNA glycosylase family 4
VSAAAAPAGAAALQTVSSEVIQCRACPRLVAWREQVGAEKRAAYANEVYWARPVPSFGDPDASVLLVGLAPAAHGGNRTGRIFTGDRSGDFLFASLHRLGFANQPHSTHAGDGLVLRGLFIAAAVRCAPPANAPTPVERDMCLSYLVRELRALSRVRVLIVLGAFAYEALWRALRMLDVALPAPRPRFGHAVEVPAGPYTIVCSFHPSQQNTFTGRLTPEMLDAVLGRARALSA